MVMTFGEQHNFTFGLNFTVQGDIRFISHRDTIRLWQRAIVRAGIPISYSQGFNPHMRLSLPLPRSVGMASNCELLMMYLGDDCSPEGIADKLKPQLPAGITITSVSLLDTRKPPEPIWASYRVLFGSGIDRERLRVSVQRFFQSDECWVYRMARRRHPARKLDLRQFVGDLKFESDTLSFTLKISPRASARVDELLKVLGLDNPAEIACVTREATGYLQ